MRVRFFTLFPQSIILNLPITLRTWDALHPRNMIEFGPLFRHANGEFHLEHPFRRSGHREYTPP